MMAHRPCFASPRKWLVTFLCCMCVLSASTGHSRWNFVFLCNPWCFDCKVKRTGEQCSGIHNRFFIFFFILYFQLDTLLFCLCTITAIFFPLQVSGLTGPSSGGLNCTCSLWYSPPLQMSLSCGRWKSPFSTAARQRHLQRGRIP